MRLTASFLAFMFRRFIPPCPTGFINCSWLRPGGVLSLLHTKFLIIRCSDVVTVVGMPWALVRNWVMPPTVIWVIRCFASRVGFEVVQLSSVFLILSSVVLHGCAWSTLFPIHAPRMRVGLPSSAILIPGGSGVSVGWRVRSSTIRTLCCLEPIGIISVFSRLNFAPEALHQVFSRFSSDIYLSEPDR